MSYNSYPNWRKPAPTNEFLGTWGVTKERNSYIVLDGEHIPWPAGSASFYSTNYKECSFIDLKTIASVRRMGEHKLRKKVDLIAALQKWDQHFKNTTPASDD